MVVSCKIKTSNKKVRSFYVVQAERLELSHLTALDPKSSVSTNSTTPATKTEIIFSFRIANISIRLNSQSGIVGILVFLNPHKNKPCPTSKNI